MTGQLGVIYMLHFSQPYKHARHYVGWTEDLLDRLDRHASGHGARLIAVITQAGIGFTLVRLCEGTRRTERAIEHHGDGGLCFGKRHGNHNALASGKPVGLDHDRCTMVAHIKKRIGRIVETTISASRNVELGAERLGEAFRSLQPRRLLAWPEGLDAGRGEIIDNAGRKRRFRSDHDQIDLLAPAERDHRGMVGDIERDALGFTGDAGIAGRAPKLCHQR